MPKPGRPVLCLCVLILLISPRILLAQMRPTDNPTGTPSEFQPRADANADEVRERMLAQRGLRPADWGDAFKLQAIAEVAKQKRLYPNQLAGVKAPAGMPQWRSIGPTRARYERNAVTWTATDTGRVRTILPHPTDPDTMYVLTSGGGLWATNNFTQQRPVWRATTDALISTSGGAVSFGRTPNTLYLGVGDPFEALGLITGVMVKSTDGGNTWSPFANLAGATNVRDVKVDTSGANDVVLVTTDVGLFRSTDDGATYTAVPDLAGLETWSLAKTSAGWLLTTDFVDANFNQLALFAYSTDRGATWSLIPNAGNVIDFFHVGRSTLAVAKPGESTVYAIAASIDGLSQRDVFKSTDGGLNWTSLHVNETSAPTNPDCFQPDLNILGGQGWYNQAILVDPTDASRKTVYIAGQLANAKSTDGGNTWTLISTWLPYYCSNLPYVHADAHAAAATTIRGQQVLLFGNDGGLFISGDGGKTWSDDKNDGIVSLLTQTVVSNPRFPDSILTGLQDCGTRARQGSSPIYNQVVGGDGEGVAWSQANTAVALASFPGTGLVRSTNLQPGTISSWFSSFQGIGGLDYYPFWTPLDTPTANADPTGQRFFTYTGWRVYKTSDGGQTWHVIAQRGANGIRTSNNPIFRITQFGHALSIHPSDINRIAVAEYSGFVAITNDGGAHWTEVQLIGIGGYGGFNKTTAWANNGTLYLGSENPNYGGVRFMRSSDGGTTWTNPGGAGLPDVPMRKIAVDPSDPSGKTVYAATWVGVYRTTDGGANWSLFGAGLPTVDVSDLYLTPDGRSMRASTYGRGVWEISLR